MSSGVKLVVDFRVHLLPDVVSHDRVARQYSGSVLCHIRLPALHSNGDSKRGSCLLLHNVCRCYSSYTFTVKYGLSP